ncbi:Gag/pol protein [Abeliophyllum distichum]|uniref:Gag/pol protein n=1 Tax=Abeliophyllum distichum TaxID=126358 RepID=A0ABD1RPZ4_9LAMI
MESRLELCIFVGYPKGTRGYYFYSPQDKKVFVSTNATFLDDRYIEECESKMGEKWRFLPTVPTGPEAPDMSGDQVPPVQSPHETEPAAEGHGGGETTVEQSQKFQSIRNFHNLGVVRESFDHPLGTCYMESLSRQSPPSKKRIPLHLMKLWMM